MIRLDVLELHLEPGSLDLDADLEVRLVGELRVTDGRQLIFAEKWFPCLELARSLLTWARGPRSNDFEFDSMSIEDVGVVWIRRIRSAGDAWRVGSVWQEAKSGEWPWADVAQAIDLFLAAVRAGAPGAVRARVAELLSKA